MPFADNSGSVACFFQHIGHCDAGGVDNQFRVSGGDTGIFLSPRIHSGEQPEAGRGAGGGGCVSVGELYSLSGKAVDMRGTDLCCSVAAKVAYAEVVREYINNVGLWGVLSIVFLYLLIASGQQGHTGQ